MQGKKETGGNILGRKRTSGTLKMHVILLRLMKPCIFGWQWLLDGIKSV